QRREFAAIDAAGKVAVVTRSDAVSPSERAVNALAAGATMLLVANDADGELSEWVGRRRLRRRHPGRHDERRAGTPGLRRPRFREGRHDDLRYGRRRRPRDLGHRALRRRRHPGGLHYAPSDLARIDTWYRGEAGDRLAEFRWDLAPNGAYGFGFPMNAVRGIERTEWVNTDVDWYQDATVLDVGWQVRDVPRSYEPGEHVETSYFGPIVRPYVGEGYFAPYRSADWMQVNLPSWADGGDARHTGAFDVFAATRVSRRTPTSTSTASC
ncbi:protease-associated domain-containing protein, partial [Agromyces flavus]|uniref:hypothetical protein n=1 Tax=Agromyces flavus TaxID=589382 RepID=UPI000B166C23